MDVGYMHVSEVPREARSLWNPCYRQSWASWYWLLGNERGSPARGICALKQRAISPSPRKSDGVIQLVTNSLILLPCDSFISFSYLMDYFAAHRSHVGLLMPSLYRLLPSVAADEKFTATCVIVPPYVICHFPLYFQDVKMCLS